MQFAIPHGNWSRLNWNCQLKSPSQPKTGCCRFSAIRATAEDLAGQTRKVAGRRTMEAAAIPAAKPPVRRRREIVFMASFSLSGSGAATGAGPCPATRRICDTGYAPVPPQVKPAGLNMPRPRATACMRVQPIAIRLALPPAAAVLAQTDRSSTSRHRSHPPASPGT